VEILEPVVDGLGNFADSSGYSPASSYRKLHEPSELHDKRIAAVFDIEFESLGGEYRRAARRPALPLCESQCGALEQKNPAGPSLCIPRDQKPSLFWPMKNAGMASLTMPDSRG
jgi:hypothetical protein